MFKNWAMNVQGKVCPFIKYFKLKNMTTYKFRGADHWEVIEAAKQMNDKLREWKKPIIKSFIDKPYRGKNRRLEHTGTLEFESTMSLRQIINLLRTLDAEQPYDGKRHSIYYEVMWQTVQPIELYTGERDTTIFPAQD